MSKMSFTIYFVQCKKGNGNPEIVPHTIDKKEKHYKILSVKEAKKFW